MAFIGSALQVVVIGAGLSGLSCARELAIKGIHVTLLEASDRVGGRTLCDSDGTDLGGAYVGCTQRRILRICERYGLGLVAVPVAGKTTQVLRNVASHYAGIIPPVSAIGALELNAAFVDIERIAAEINPHSPESHPEASKLDFMTCDEYVRRMCPFSSDAQSILRTAIRAILCVESCEISVLAFCWYLSCNGGPKRAFETVDGLQECKIRGGTGRVSPLIVQELQTYSNVHIVLNCPVRLVDYTDILRSPTGTIRILTDRGDFVATHVVLCVPPVQRARIATNPPRSVQEQAALTRWPMGHVIKTFVYYSEPFWRDKMLNGTIVCDAGIVMVTYDDTKDDGSLPAIMGFILASGAADAYKFSPEERCRFIAQHYAKVFKDERALHPIRYKEKVWSQEPWVGGCYVGVPIPGTLTQYPLSLIKKSPHERLLYAGTETSYVGCGYMDGAVASGEAAAVQILTQNGLLRPSEAEAILKPAASRLMRERAMQTTRLERALPSSRAFIGIVVTIAIVVTAWIWNRIV